MLFSSHLKRYVFVAARCKTSGDVRKVLVLIEKHGADVRNRTHLNIEQGDWEGYLPVRIMPKTSRLVLQKLDDIEGDLSVKSVKNLPADFLETVQAKLPLNRAFMDIGLSLKKSGTRNLRVQVALIEEKWFLGFQFYSHPKDFSEAEVCFNRLIQLGDLPMTIRATEGGFVLQHNGGGEVMSSPNNRGPCLEKEESLLGFAASLPSATITETWARFQSIVNAAEVQTRDGRWWLLFHNVRLGGDYVPEEVCQILNGLGIPGRKVSCSFGWSLQNYRDFEKMPLMTRYVDWPPSQSLLEFQFGNGRSCQVDIMCKASNKYRLFLSFDEAEAADELATLFKIKLTARED
jgi:hypothetical protein